ncbi:MAG: trypsin-like peptidase domain-containing protein [Oscillospiraceae bacterium]|nr:trypsin-like peptidase domain-containing protein [Oscillospiraceae bacterium]
MSEYENDYTPAPRKRSPYEDSPYACAYIEHEPVEPMQPEPPKPAQKRQGWKVLLVCILLAAACGITAVLVNMLWQSRFDKMELALQERFAALEEKYSQNQTQNTQTQLPPQGPLTPSEIYTKNVQAVVAVNATIEKSGSYGQSAGSGFIISADGYIATNHHVINGASKVTVTTHTGDSLEAKIVGKDATNDVALLKVEGENLPFATLGSSDELAVGDMVVAIGNPLGELISTLTVGYVSAKDRIVDTDGSVINMLQTDAAINAGNSGGPLFNTKGEVIGIVTAKYSGSSGSDATIEGLGFAIPTDDIISILSDLKEFGYVTGAYLGVKVRDVDASGQSYGLPAGAYVAEVIAGNAADKAGVRVGDIIVNLGGYKIDSLTALTRVLRRLDAGQTVSVTVYRGGQEKILTITLDEKPVEQEQQPTQNNNNNSNNQNPGAGGFEDWFGGFFPPFFGN